MIKIEPAEASLRLVIVENPYLNIENQLVRELFPQIIRLKRRGYTKEHAANVLPLGVDDFHGTHFLVCTEKDGALTPICGNRGAHLSVCRYHNIPFPAQALVAATNPSCAETISQHEEKCVSLGMDLIYLGSFVVDPEYRTRRHLARIRALFSTLLGGYKKFHNPNSRFLTAAVQSVGTEKFCRWLGFERISDDCIYNHAALNNTTAAMMTLEDFSGRVHKCLEDNMDAWEDCVFIGAPLGGFARV